MWKISFTLFVFVIAVSTSQKVDQPLQEFRRAITKIIGTREYSLVFNGKRHPLTNLPPDTFNGLDNFFFLQLKHNQINVLHNNTFRTLFKLRELELSRNKIREIEVDTFSGLTLLWKLSLSYNELENFPAGAFKDLKSLNVLSLSNNRIKILSLHMFEGLQNNWLTLDLSSNSIQHIEPNTFRNFKLTTLCLSMNKLTVLEADTFNGLRIHSRFDLDNNHITNIKRQAFRNLTGGTLTLDDDSITEIQKVEWGLSDSVHIM